MFKKIILLTILSIPALLFVLVYMQTVPPVRAQRIPGDYFKLRDRFIEAASARGASLQEFPIEARGPNGEPLSFQVAWLGDPNPKEAILHISGVHGVEGYAGSAIQSELLEAGYAVPRGDAVIFVHGLNPWGMAYHRRFNESNVDLNRNFILDQNGFKGAPDAYRLIESFLNPKGVPSRVDGFYPLVLANVLKHGFNTLKQAIAGGQYEFEQGIYFGGKKMEQSLTLFRDFLKQRLSGVKKLYVIEIHTGLGTSGKDVLFWPLSLKDPKSVAFSAALGEELATDAPDEGVGFRTPGDLQNEAPKLLPNTEVFWLLQEFGAYGPVRTLRALRDENRYHQSGGKELKHWSKQTLVEIFSPGSDSWQEKVLHRGEVLFSKMLKLMGESSPS